MSLHIRTARSTDAGKLGAMVSGALATNTWKPKLHSEAEDIAHMGDLIARGWVRVCVSAGEVAGFLAREDERIQSLYVRDTSQNMGIGTFLLNETQGLMTRLELWTFQANKGARRFYERHGFEELERTDGAGNDEGLPDIHYVWVKPDEESNNG